MIPSNGLLTAALAIVYCIIPSVSTQRPRTKQQSRGTPVWTNLSNLALQELDAQSRQEVKGESRSIAFVSASKDAPISEAELLAAVLARHAAHYRDLAVVDALTVRQLFSDCQSASDALQVGQDQMIDIVVWCEADDESLTATVLTADAAAAESPQLNIKAGDAWLSKLNQQPNQFFRAMKLEAPASEDHIAQVPTKDEAAFRKGLEATKTLHQAIGLEDASKRARLCDAAIELATEAIRFDPNFLEAYLIKASCQDERGQDEALKQTLRDAYARKNPQVHDSLVLHELEADYAHFCTGDLEGAMNHYMSILETNPSDLRALWALVDIYLTGDGVNTPAQEDIALASELAARIIVFHPQSAVARALQEK